MSIYGKLGNTVIAQQNLMQPVPGGGYPQNAYANQQPQVQVYGGSIVPQQGQPQQAKKAIYIDFVKLKINNPVVTTMKDDASHSVNYDVVKYFDTIKIPDITSLQKILENCDTAKSYYNDLLKIEKFDTDDQKSQPKKNGFSFNDSSIPLIAPVDHKVNNSHHMPSPVKNTRDVDKFVEKFKCSRQTAEFYMETFRTFEEASKQYQAGNP